MVRMPRQLSRQPCSSDEHRKLHLPYELKHALTCGPVCPGLATLPRPMVTQFSGMNSCCFPCSASVPLEIPDVRGRKGHTVKCGGRCSSHERGFGGTS